MSHESPRSLTHAMCQSYLPLHTPATHAQTRAVAVQSVAWHARCYPLEIFPGPAARLLTRQSIKKSPRIAPSNRCIDCIVGSAADIQGNRTTARPQNTTAKRRRKKKPRFEWHGDGDNTRVQLCQLSVRFWDHEFRHIRVNSHD